MRLFSKRKDGGPTSPVDGYFLIEIKGLFSIALLKFNKGRREAYHTHAFNALTWFISGELVEERFDGTLTVYERSLLPKVTLKDNNHRVKALENSWCLTIRGPWGRTWIESDKTTQTRTTFSHGRVVVSKFPL